MVETGRCMQKTAASLVSKERRLGNIEALRFVAALMIVVVHLFGLYDTKLGLLPGLIKIVGSKLEYGVDIFFAISGFVIALNLDNPKTTPSRFIKARLARIAPSYWILTLVGVVAYLVLPAAFNGVIEGKFALTSMLFVSQYFGYQFPVLASGWSLNIEMFFYAVVFTVMVLRVPRKLVTLVASLAIIGLAMSSAVSTVALEFIFGFLVYRFWPVVQNKTWLGYVSAVISVALLCVQPDLLDTGNPRFLFYGLPGALALISALAFPQWKASVLPRLGFASYSLYLTQWFSIAILGVLLQKLQLQPWLAVPSLIGAVIAVAAAGVMYSEWIDSKLYAGARSWLKL